MPVKSADEEMMDEQNSPVVYEQLPQLGPVIPGPGALRDPLALLGLGREEELTRSEKKKLKEAIEHAQEVTARHVLRKQALAQQAQKQRLVQRQQALTLMCKLYVGSITFELRDVELRNAFEPFGCITRLDLTIDPALGRHRGFAFIEYDLPDAAYLAAKEMHGFTLAGRPLKVKVRPEDLPQSQAIVAEIIAEAQSYHRAYVASVHPDIADEDVRKVFEPFGNIRSCRMVRADPRSTRHKGYGFIEFETAHAMEDAIRSMNHFQLLGRSLRVGRAVTPPDVFQQVAAATSAADNVPQAVTLAAAAATAKIQAFEAVASNVVQAMASGLQGVASPTVPLATAVIPPPIVLPPPQVATILLPQQPVQQAQPSYSQNYQPQMMMMTEEASQRQHQEEMERKLQEEIPETLQQEETMTIKGSKARQAVMEKLKRDSRVVILRNMVGPNEVDEELEEDVKIECEKYGTVERVIIYQEQQVDGEEVVKIFVEFAQAPQATAARQALHKRLFAGRVVHAELYDQTLYDAKYFSG